MRNLRFGPSGPFNFVELEELRPGVSGQYIYTNALGQVVWVTPGMNILPVGVPGQQIFAAPVTGLATWAAPLGHSESTELVGAIRETDSTVQVGQSVSAFDASALVAASGGLVRATVLEAIVWATAGMTAEIELYNLTDGAAVAGTLLTTISNVPIKLASAALAVPAVLPNSEKLYELRLRISAGVPGPADRAYVSGARLLTRWS